MRINIDCPRCSADLTLEPAKNGEIWECPDCDLEFEIKGGKALYSIEDVEEEEEEEEEEEWDYVSLPFPNLLGLEFKVEVPSKILAAGVPAVLAFLPVPPPANLLLAKIVGPILSSVIGSVDELWLEVEGHEITLWYR